MADLYLEYDYLPKKKQRRRALKKRPRWPFVLLGFFIGFITLPALIAGAVFLFVSRPVEKTVNSIDKMTNAGLYETLFGKDDKVGILNDRYGEMALKDALGDIIKIAEKGSELSFKDLAEISPKVTESIDKLIESAEEKSIILDKEEVMTTPLNKFSDLLMDEVKEIELGEVLLATKSDIFDDESTGAILKNLFFGKFGVNYTVDDGKIKMLPISYVYDSENNTFTCVDETVYTLDGEIWRTENSDNYIAVYGEGFALYSPYKEIIYQMQPSVAKSLTTFTAVTVNAEGVIQTVKQKSLALGDFMDKDSNPMDIIGKLELGTMLGITTRGQAEEEGNAMLVALAYGTFGEDFYYDGEQDSSLIIAKKGGKPFTTLNDLMNSPDEILNGMKLGSLLGITTKADAEKDGNSMLVALAYGTFGTDYTYDGDSDNSAIIPIGDKKFTTLDDLINSPDELLNGIQLGSLLGITTETEAKKDGNEMLVALAYGTYGVDFDYDTNGNIVNKTDGKPFTTLGDLINNPDTVLNGIQLGSLLGITTHADAVDEKNSMLVALAYGTYGTDYKFACDGVECTDKACTNPNCTIVRVETSDRAFTTLDDLMNKSDEVLNDIRLGTLLGITTRADVENGKNDMMVAIAYGTFGVDFDYDTNGNIQPIGDKEFTTLGTLINSPDTVLNTIQLGSLLGITTHADAVDEKNSMLVALAYGTYGTDYKFACDGVECTDKDCTNPNCIVVKLETSDRAFTTLNDLMNNSDKVLNDIRLGTLLGITTKGDVESGKNDMMVAIAYGTYGVNFDYDGNSPESLIIPIGDKPFTTLGDLINNPDTVLNTIQLGSLLGITTHADAINDNNKMLVALAYGTYGTDYAFSCDGAECTDKDCTNPNCIVVKLETSDRAFTTLDDLMNKSDEVLNDIPLGTLLGITTREDVESGDNDMMVAIAYGTHDVDFIYDTSGNIISNKENNPNAKPFTTLGGLINTPNDVLKTLQIGTLLGITTKDHIEGNTEKNIQAADSLLVSIAFGTYDVDFEYDANGKIVPKAGGKPFTTVEALMNADEAETIFKNIPLSSIFAVDVFDENEDPLTVALVYGTKGKHYVISQDENGNDFIDWQVKDPTTGEKYKERTFGDLRDDDLTKFVEDLKVSDVFTINATSPKLLQSISDWSISDLSDDTMIKGLMIEDVMDVAENDNFLQAIKGWKIGEIGEDKIKGLTIGEVITIDSESDAFLQAIQGWKIGEIGQDLIKDLTIGDVIAINSESDPFLQKIKTWKIGDIGQNKIKELQLKDVIQIDSSDDGIMSIMGDWYIGEFNEDKIKSIPLNKVLPESNENGLLATLANKKDADGNAWTIAHLTETNIQSLTLKEVLPGAIGSGENDFFSALADAPLKDLNATYIKNTLTIGQALGITAENEGEYGILTTFKDTHIKDFNEALLKSTLTIGDVVDTDHPILNVLKDKHLNEINEDLIQSELEKLKLSQIIELEDGEELHPIFKTLQNETLGNITKGNVIDTIKVGDALGLTLADLGDDDAILKQIIGLNLGDLKNSNTLKDKINNLPLSEFIGTSTQDGIFKEMSSWTIGEINENKVNSITLATIFNVSDGDTGLLATLAGKKDSEGNLWTIEDLTSTNINGLTLAEVLGEEEVDGNFYLKHLSGSTLGSLATDIQNISVLDLFADSMEYETDASGNIVKDENGHPVIKGTWKYLLNYNPDDKNSYPYTAPDEYKVTDMNKLIENMHNNIEKATLKELHDDNMLPHLGTTTLETRLMYQIRKDGVTLVDFTDQVLAIINGDKQPGDEGYYEINDSAPNDGELDDKTIGDLTVLDVAKYLTALLDAIHSML